MSGSPRSAARITNNSKKIKIVVVGDGTVGKTCLCLVYANKIFPAGYVPTIFENYTAKVSIRNEEHTLSLFDTAGQEGFDRLRLLAYPETDVFLICFALDLYSTFVNVQEEWLPEIRKHSPTAKILLVGTKSDLKDKRTVSLEHVRKFAKQANVVDYVECSSLQNVGVKEVFDQAILAALTAETKKQGCCSVQ